MELTCHIPVPLKGVNGDIDVVSKRNVQRRREQGEGKGNCPISGISIINDCFFLPLTPSEPFLLKSIDELTSLNKTPEESIC
jgi:hypothetical protein